MIGAMAGSGQFPQPLANARERKRGRARPNMAGECHFPGLDPLEPLEGVTGGGETGRMGA